MFLFKLGKYRQVTNIKEVGNGLVSFNYSLNFMSYKGVSSKSDLYEYKDLPINAEIVKHRSSEKLKRTQSSIIQRINKHKFLIATKQL